VKKSNASIEFFLIQTLDDFRYGLMMVKMDQEKRLGRYMWITSVLHKIENCKAKHRAFLKEAATTLELALWKSRLSGDNNDVPSEGDEKGSAECRNNCGADMSIIILNVLLFLKIE
jgi:hypothetical protein